MEGKMKVIYHKCPTCDAPEMVIDGTTDAEVREQYRERGPCRMPSGRIRYSIHETRPFSLSDGSVPKLIKAHF